MRRPIAFAGSLMLLALVAAACAKSEPASSAVASGPTAPELSSSADPTVTGGSGPGGPNAPEVNGPVAEILRFEAPLVGGGTLRGAELAGAPVALWFWAPW